MDEDRPDGVTHLVEYLSNATHLGRASTLVPRPPLDLEKGLLRDTGAGTLGPDSPHRSCP